MPALTIFSDATLSASALDLLRTGTTEHRVIEPRVRAASVLAKSEPDPRFIEAEIAFGQPDLADIERSERLRWIHLTSAGFTRYDTPEFRALAAQRGLLVTNSSTVYAEACAEHVFAFMLAESRQLPIALRSRTGSGAPEWNALRNGCASLRGQHAVILGFGAIAARLVQLLAPFAMALTALRRHPRGDEGIPTVPPEHLDAALATADHVINILPANAASQHFIDAPRLAAMKPGARFYNIGRGTTVNQNALAAALRSGHLAAAWLDVTDPEPLPDDHALRALPNCYITPHVAGGQRLEADALVRHFLANLQRYIASEPLLDRILTG